MGKFKNGFIAKIITAMLLVSMIASSLDVHPIAMVRAEDGTLVEATLENETDVVEEPDAEVLDTEETNTEETDVVEPETEEPTEGEVSAEEETSTDGIEAPSEEAETPTEETEDAVEEETTEEIVEETEPEENKEIQLSAAVNDVEITLTTTKDAFPGEGELSLSVEEITDERLEKVGEKVNEEIVKEDKFLATYRLFDVTPMMDGKEIQPGKPVNLSFENLVLEREDGSKINVVSTLEKEADDAVQKETTEEQIALYTINNEQTAEEVVPEIKENSVMMMTDEVGEYLVAAEGNVEWGTPSTTDTYESNQGKHDIAYIHSNFNIFIQESYEGTHVVGPMLVGGHTTMTGNLGGLSGIPDTDIEKHYQHQVSSYWKGETDTFNDRGKLPVVITGRKDLPIYFGLANKEFYKGKLNPEITPYYFTDSYFDFDAAFGEDGWLHDQVDYYKDYEGYSECGRKVEKVTITVDDLAKVTDENPTYQGNGFTIKKSPTGSIRPDGENYEILLDMNRNYVFGPGVFKQLFAMIFNYQYLEELADTMTIIQTEDSGVVSIPRVYKSVKSDALGDNYDFGSIESYPEFSVLYLAPNATDVFAGLSDKNYATKDPYHPFYNTSLTGKENGSRLVGHLCVPQANVFLGGGNYNGSIIAKNVDAVCAGAEGHMWPFQKNEFDGNLKLYLKKMIEGKAPGENTFKFIAELYKKNADNTEELKENKDLTNIKSGLIGTEFKFTEAGYYRLRIEEKDLEGDQDKMFTKDPVVYEADIEMQQQGTGTDSKLIPIISWYRVTRNANDTENRTAIDNPMASNLVFNNQTDKKLSVEKIWLDEEGETLSVGTNQDITVNLYRSIEEPDGYKVNFEIYKTDRYIDFAGYEPEKVTEFGSWYIDKNSANGNISFTSQCTEYNETYKNYAAGIYRVEVIGENNIKNAEKLSNGEYSVLNNGKAYYTQETWKVSNITENITVKIYYTVPLGEELTPVTPEDFELYNVRSDSFAETPGEVIKTITLSQATEWHGAFYGLEEFDENHNRYYYSIKEEPEVPGFTVSYDGDTINTGEGNITIINQKIPIDINLTLMKKEKDTEKTLPGAEFELRKDGKLLYFTKTVSGEHQYCGLDGDADLPADKTSILKTGEDGIWKIIDIPKGTYSLKETRAPDGYNLETRTMIIEVGEEGISYKFEGVSTGTTQKAISTEENIIEFGLEFDNTPGVELPESGGIGTNMFTIGGILFMGISLLMMFYEFAKRRKEATFR